MKGFITLLAVSLAFGMLLIACDGTSGRTPAPESATGDLLDQVMSANRLVVATDPLNPPHSFLDERGQLDGFDVDVSQAVAKRLNVELDFVTPEWSEITGGYWGGQWDISIGSMTATEDRSKSLWFTDPYCFTPASFAVHNDNTTFAQPADLAGKTLGLVEATTYEAYLNGTLSLIGEQILYAPPLDLSINLYTADADAFADLALGDGVRLDAVMAARPTIQEAIGEGLPLRFIGTPAFYEPVVFALDKSRGPSAKMVSRLNDILTDMRADGTLTDLSLQWYGSDLTSR